MLTDKQIKTLMLFAQNYSLKVIAKKMKVSLSTIRERISTLSRAHPTEFNNALAIRNSYKRIQLGLKHPHKNIDKKKSLKHKF